MRKPIIVANWKMNKSVQEAESFATEFLVDVSLAKEVDVVICPPFTALSVVRKGIKGKGISLGGQNLYPSAEGAFTGEVSPLMLRDLGCTYVILGHSERRHLLGETDEFIKQKVSIAFAYDLVPILCVGETLSQREKGKTEEVCRHQLLSGLEGVQPDDLAQMVIAYEPVWAIGTGVHASSQDAEKTIAFLRRVISSKWGQTVGEAVRLQYGGSVKPENIKEFMSCANIDGALVGGASLKTDSFYELVRGARRGSE